MATKLRNLKVTKVDFVDEGANPDAHIKLYKRKDSGLGEEAPVDDNTAGKSGGVLKRLLSFIAKAAGIEQEELDSAMEEIEKAGAMTFNENMLQRRSQKIADEMWDTCFALQSSLVSIMQDEELDASAAQTAMKESLDDFCDTVQGAISQWSSGKMASITKTSTEVTENELEVMKSARDRLNDMLQKACKTEKAEKDVETGNKEKEELEGEKEMKIDKIKMTSAERAFYEDIEKRYGSEEGTPADGQTTVASPVNGAVASETGAENPVAKALQALGIQNPAQAASAEPSYDGAEDIYKGLHPAVKAEIEALRKFRQDAEDKEIREVAKRYAIIGKKEDELFPVLKSLKAAGGTAYDDMVAILDQTKETVEKSGAFSEIGKSGHGGAVATGGAWVEAEQKAAEIMKSKNITKNQALDEVFQANPELARKCEEEG